MSDQFEEEVFPPRLRVHVYIASWKELSCIFEDQVASQGKPCIPSHQSACNL
jgi:hypothetical protein